MKTKRVIGITGGIGSGKSLVASLFNSLGFPVYNSDVEAKKIYLVQEVKTLVIDLLGEESYSSGELNRSYIGQLVFNDSKLLSALNKIIHPAVTKHFNEWVKMQDNTVLLKEAAVLIESGAYKGCDAIITVSAEEQIRIQRVIKRDGVTESDVKARMNNQLSDSEREKYANWIIINDGSASLIKQIMEIYHTDFSVK